MENKTAEQILQFIYQRLINLYGENENCDFMRKFFDVAYPIEKQTHIPSAGWSEQMIRDFIKQCRETRQDDWALSINQLINYFKAALQSSHIPEKG